MGRNADAFHSLTPRERDCLRLLHEGLLTPQVAATLGMAVATLNKHLASARRKLGVSRTAQALLLCPRDELMQPLPGRNTDRARQNGSPAAWDFADAIEACATVHDAWETLRAHVGRLGVTELATFVIAEPPGQLTNGARRIGMSGPEPLKEMYREMGDANADPVNRRIAEQMKSVLVDNEELVSAIANVTSGLVVDYGRALLDENIRFALYQPERDRFSGAPLANVFIVDPREVVAFRRSAKGNPRETLQAISAAFWSTVQDKRMLRSVAGLTRRQVEALNFAARGFTIEESAERMNVSRRSAERTLAVVRKALGAPTTSAAIYRAMVYRAIG